MTVTLVIGAAASLARTPYAEVPVPGRDGPPVYLATMVLRG